MQTATQVRSRRTGRTAADSKLRGKGKGPFSRYGPEEERAVRIPEVKKDATLRQLKAAWRKFEQAYLHRIRGVEYENAIDAIRGLKYTAMDVEKFSLAMIEFQGENLFFWKAGIFLSALVNEGQDSDYVIHTKHLDYPPVSLGFANTKNIIVEGNVGHGFGCLMEKGRVIVNGNAYDSLGQTMYGGSITVNGNVSYNIGITSRGGEIHINGRFEAIATSNCGVRVFHQGRQVWPKN